MPYISSSYLKFLESNCSSDLENHTDPNSRSSTEEVWKDNVVLVRCDRGGVFYGTLLYLSEDGKVGVMDEARNIWKWEGKPLATIDIANIGSSRDSKFTSKSKHPVMFTDIVSIHPLTAIAKRNLNAVPDYIDTRD